MVKYCSPGLVLALWNMPCSLDTYRARIGNYGSFSAMDKIRVKSFFKSSFLLYILHIVLNMLHPFIIVGSLFFSLLISLTVLALLLVLSFFAVLFFQNFLFSMCSTKFRSKNKHIPLFHFFELSFFLIIETIVAKILLVAFGTIERNPGPNNYLKFATWNVDSLLTREGSKISMIEGLDSCHHFDILGLCETYFTDNTSEEHTAICGFSDKPFRADCKNTEVDGARPRGGVCLYFKEHLPIVNRPDLVLTNETIISEIRLGRKKIFFILSYRPPSMSTVGDVAAYCSNLKDSIDKIARENPSLVVLTGDFNARSPLFWSEERHETMPGEKLSNFMLLNCLEQLIAEPTHFPRDDIETCIDLIFTDKPSYFVDSGVIPSPDPRCKHQVIHGTINFSVPSPPPYKRNIWKYDQANVPSIKNNIGSVNWEELFDGRSVDDMVSILTDKLLSIMSDNIPNKIITVNDKDAPWVTPEVKGAIKRNRRVFDRWKGRGRPEGGRALVQEVQIETNSVIDAAKESYIKDLSDKLCNPRSSNNIFWSAFKRLLNNKKHTNIPPLLDNNIFTTSFIDKANIFNTYFASICRPLDNGSILPALTHSTHSRLSSVDFSHDSITEVISKLNANKAHGVDQISIAMLKLCSKEISKPLKIIFDHSIAVGKFPSTWKLANVQPVHKKNSRQLKSNYRPISLLPIFSKIFEKLIFDTMYGFFVENDLISKHQSGFRPGDSTINQLLAITDEIYQSFENNAETRAAFLDISKAFDKVWHEGLLFKLKHNGVSGNLLSFISDYLSDRKQRVVLNGMESSWLPIESGVPQGSVLGPLLFLVYINDLTEGISSNMRLFADDSSLFIKVRDIEESQTQLMEDLDKITSWARQWKMEFNPDLSKQAIEVIFSHKKKKPIHPPLHFNGIPVKRETHTQHLGVILDQRLSFRLHIVEKIKKANKGLGLLKFLSRYTTRPVLDKTYKMYVRPHLDYGDIIYHNQLKDSMQLLESVQYRAALIVTGCWKGTSRAKLYADLGWESLSDRRHFRRLSMFYRIKNGLSPPYLAERVRVTAPNTTNRYANSFFPYCQLNWNNLDASVKNLPTLSQFKSALLKTIRPSPRSYYNITDKIGIHRLAQLRLGLSDLRDHRKNHHFVNCPVATCACSLGPETTKHFLLECNRFVTQRNVLMTFLSGISPNIDVSDLQSLTDILLYGSKKHSFYANTDILNATIAFVKSSKRFDRLEAFNQTIP